MGLDGIHVQSEFPVQLPSKEDPQMTLSREGSLFILHWHHKDNRFNVVSCKALLEALQIVENIYITADEPEEMALITTGDGKIFSNGLELIYAAAYPPFMDLYFSVLKKMLTFCIPTIAALNGHAFAGGCLFAMTHDYRVMRSDRGFLCMNEVEFAAPLSPGMSAVLQYKLTPVVYRDMVLRAHRFPAKEALEKGIVDHIVPENEVLPFAKELGNKLAPLAKSGSVAYKQLKDQMYSEIVERLGQPYHRLAARM
ncbi:ClpP/crotonase [Hesseltinella vesiculosa]|uniref:ClpP/crotonase n=1 Tax=Hesseltinella vesiculosa TaxID=101127 RepID=A0A1X2G3R9_9FUNG|nr:ClpP/crotonase [Hesseltinella vesiculosa]